MAFRKIHDSFWTDPDMEDLSPDQKLFYIYLITNPKVNQIGLYEFSKKRASFETGYSIDTVSKLLKYFIDTGKIIVSKKTNEILIVKFYYHNKSTSPKLKTHINGLLGQVKDRVLIQYIYSIDTASQEEEEEDKEEYKVNNTPPSNDKKRRNENNKLNAPTESEVADYFEENGYKRDSGIRAFQFYNPEWVDSNGKKVRNWKQKMRGVWFKDENRKPIVKPIEQKHYPSYEELVNKEK